ncbi:hypothetical protein BLA29_011789, partial [Euroglyphus maynei]
FELEHQLRNSKRAEIENCSQSSRVHFKRFNSFDSSLVQLYENNTEPIFNTREHQADLNNIYNEEGIQHC